MKSFLHRLQAKTLIADAELEDIITKKDGHQNTIESLYATNIKLKLAHWEAKGKGSYAHHVALDEALEDLNDILDRFVETSLAQYGEMFFTIPKVDKPEDIIYCIEMTCKHLKVIDYLESWSQAIIDDYIEALYQLLYRLNLE